MIDKLSLSIRSYSRIQEQHAHSYCQLIFPIHGQIDIEISGNKQTIGPKRLAIISNNEFHRFSAHENARFLVADLPALQPKVAE